MLTRLRVQGFKNLLDIDVQFGPFTCIAGRNAVGKSNLFDAIQFLHALSQSSILDATRLIRKADGRSPDLRSLFTSFGSYRSPVMRFTADLLIRRDAQDDFGVTARAAVSSLRYRVAFRLGEEDGRERLELIEETLSPMSREEALGNLTFAAGQEFRDSAVRGRRTRDFISTIPSSSGPAEIRVHREAHTGRSLPAARAHRTVVNGMASIDFPTILAVNHEMQSWQTLLLEPSALRSPSPYSDSGKIDTRGGGLPAAIERLRRTESSAGQTFSTLANALSELIDDVRELRVRDDESTQTYALEIRGRDGIFHPAVSLSDGTLRYLVLATLAMTPEDQGVICLEEPENGIHPERIPAMVQLLKDIAVDPSYAVSPENPLRQVIVNTHSPVVVGNLLPAEVLFLDEIHLVRGGAEGRVATVLVPSGTWRSRLEGEASQDDAWLEALEPKTCA
jgi:predicted ATPase